MFRPGASACVLFVLMGCSLVVGELPEPLQDDDAGASQSGGPSGGSSSAGQGGTSASGGSPEMPDAGPPAGGTSGEPDAADGSQPTTMDDAGFDPCDRDDDGEPNEDCGGHDCDDDDDQVFPSQQRFFEEPSRHKGFDYDCSTHTEREYPVPLSCTTDLSLCDTDVQGFLDDPLPLCGAQGNWGHCAAMQIGTLPATCEKSQPDEMRRVACH